MAGYGGKGASDEELAVGLQGKRKDSAARRLRNHVGERRVERSIRIDAAKVVHRLPYQRREVATHQHLAIGLQGNRIDDARSYGGEIGVGGAIGIKPTETAARCA